ncbi:MAG: hypothetical protein ACFB0B_21465 [Thermonemataceae bacterium]
MRYFFLLLILVSVSLTSCNNDDDNDDPQPEPERAEVSFADQEELVTFSEGMRSSSNPYAIQTVIYGSLINGIYQSNKAYMNISEDAEFDQGCWSWGDGQGNAVRYCFTETATDYNFSAEIRFSGGAFQKVYEGTEKKDGSSGNIDYYDFETGSLVANLSWQVAGAEVTWTWSVDNDKLEIKYNESTQMGSLEYIENGVLTYGSTWNNQTCSGTYNDYEAGDAGTWNCSSTTN